jgi:hypothetical protein
MKIDFSEIADKEIYSIDNIRQQKSFLNYITQLCNYHTKRCKDYNEIVSVLFSNWPNTSTLEQIPYIPIRLFKQLDLISIERQYIFKTVTSSGTSSDRLSRIYLDKETVNNQTKVLSKIISYYCGDHRLPMLIIDSIVLPTDSAERSAKNAGSIGFSMFASKKYYALNLDGSINSKEVQRFFEENKGKKKIIYGFTAPVYEALILQKEFRDLLSVLELNDNEVFLFHGGGWKKLSYLNVNNADFRQKLCELLKTNYVHNYYGMAEQIGSIFVECEFGYFHPSVYSEILIRNHVDFTVLPIKKEGIIQVMSLLPLSYPGHSILTEDTGEIIDLDGCKCGKSGKYFLVKGRLPKAELRGCSDV